MLAWLLLALATAHPDARVVGQLVERLELGGCDSAQPWTTTGLAVNPDVQTVAMFRFEKQAPKPEARWSDLAYLRLVDGHLISRVPVGWCIAPVLAISLDGASVVVLRQTDGGWRSPYTLSLWRPYADPGKVRDYDLSSQREEKKGWLTRFAVSSDRPAISPDGTSVAVFGYKLSYQVEGPLSRTERVVGVLSLETGQVEWMALPMSWNDESANPRFWCLGWSADGLAVYAVVHGDYPDEKTRASQPGSGAFVPVRPDLVLYRYSMKAKVPVRVGFVPPTTCGFGADGSMIVADTAPHVWGPHRGFARVPVSLAERQAFPDKAAAAAFASGLAMEETITADDATYDWFHEVYVGKSRIYAQVRQKARASCRVLAELVTSGDATK